jgi:hypothetical protein
MLINLVWLVTKVIVKPKEVKQLQGRALSMQIFSESTHHNQGHNGFDWQYNEAMWIIDFILYLCISISTTSTTSDWCCESTFQKRNEAEIRLQKKIDQLICCIICNKKKRNRLTNVHQLFCFIIAITLVKNCKPWQWVFFHSVYT